MFLRPEPLATVRKLPVFPFELRSQRLDAFVRGLETAYALMWESFCKGTKPKILDASQP